MEIKKIASAAAMVLAVTALPAFAKPHGKNAKAAQNGSWPASQQAQFDQQFARFDTNRDGVISRAEFPADASLFDRLDVNRDGLVTRGEIGQALPDRASAQRQARAYDRNGDGVITRDEFPGDPATFDRLDRNRDGVLSAADDYGQYGAQSGNRFRGMDRNGDGVITRDEWRGNDNSFRVHDRNGDGVLSGDEMRGNGRGNGKDRGEEHGRGHGRGHGDDRDDD